MRGTRRVDDVTGELHEVRADTDAKLHVEGGGSPFHGNKFVLVAARNADDRLLLDVEHDAEKKGDRGEAGAALRCFERLEFSTVGAVASSELGPSFPLLGTRGNRWG